MTLELPMKIKVVVHEAEDGGYWAEVPSIPGCATQGESFEELLANLYEAVKGCLSVDVQDVVVSKKGGEHVQLLDLRLRHPPRFESPRPPLAACRGSPAALPQGRVKSDARMEATSEPSNAASHYTVPLNP